MVDLQRLDAQQMELYQRLQAFSVDQADAALPFSQRLARENGWSLEFAQRVIEEYKKFVFLAIVSGHPVTPSDAVDQVWHLHLTYTRSYWEDFCSTVLQTPLHHEPTQGGRNENEKFEDWYEKTLESYDRLFGETPPPDIWHSTIIRFGRDLHFVRVNTQQHWVIPKLRVSQRAGVIGGACLTLVIFALILIGSSTNSKSVASILFILILITTSLGVITTLVGVVNALKPDPARRIIGPDYFTTGCGGGCSDESIVNWEIDFGSHHSSDSGCGSAGCGGSGCGGCGGS